MIDPNFDGTVVLICTHDEEGTVGLTLNRPLQLPLAQVLPSAKLPHKLEASILWGGPVGQNCLHLLSGSGADSNSCMGSGAENVLPILPGVFFGGSLEFAQRVSENHGQLRFFLGYSGWGPGQLDQELAAEAWFVVPGVVSEIWTKNWRLMWERLMAAVDPQFHWMREIPENPEVN